VPHVQEPVLEEVKNEEHPPVSEPPIQDEEEAKNVSEAQPLPMVPSNTQPVALPAQENVS
jgi:hypothetical protein